MFGGKTNKVDNNDHKLTTIISAGSEIVGDLHFRGRLQIDGKVYGNLVADDDSSASVIISEKGLVQGEISAPQVNIAGRVIGHIHACERLELSQTAEIDGDVFYNYIEMEKGSQVQGCLTSDYRGLPEDCPSMPKTTTQPRPEWKTEVPLLKSVKNMAIEAV